VSGTAGRGCGSVVLFDVCDWVLGDFLLLFFFSSRRRHTRLVSDWSSDVCSSDLRPMDPCAGAVITAAGLGQRRAAAPSTAGASRDRKSVVEGKRGGVGGGRGIEKKKGGAEVAGVGSGERQVLGETRAKRDTTQ